MLNILKTDWANDCPTLLSIREAVFIHEQNVPVELEIDEYDALADHWLAYLDTTPIATARLSRNGKIGRMAVLKPYRGLGFGGQLLQAVIDEARDKKFREVSLSAQQHAIPFYESAGFIAEGPIYMDAGIPHQDMRLILREERKLGEDSQKFSIENLTESVAEMTAQCQRQLRILSPALDPEIYGSEAFAEQISALARKHRDVFVRLLILDDKPLRQSRHPLVTLSQRLSAVEIRVLPNKQPIEHNECYLLADNLGLLVYRHKIDAPGWGSYNLKPVVEEYTVRFDRHWHHSRPSPWLRTLY